MQDIVLKHGAQLVMNDSGSQLMLQKLMQGSLQVATRSLMLIVPVNICPADGLGSLWGVHEGTCRAGQP